MSAHEDDELPEWALTLHEQFMRDVVEMAVARHINPAATIHLFGRIAGVLCHRGALVSDQSVDFMRSRLADEFDAGVARSLARQQGAGHH